MLKVKIPNICENEIKYTLDILLVDFLGLSYEVQIYEGSLIEITRPKIDKVSKLTLDVSFF